MAVSVGLVVIGLIALGVGVASSSEGHRSGRVRPSAESFGVSIQPVFDAAGNPLLVANFSPDGSSATVGWAICRPGGASCRSVGTNHGELQPGPEPAGTRFVASAEYRGQAYSASVHWLGAVRALRTPRLVGEARLGGVVNPVAGTWAGGWGSDSDQLGVEACRTRTGHDCRMLGGGEYGCPDRSSRTRLGGWFTSWYLFAIDARLPKDGLCAGTGYFDNADLPLWKLGPTVVRSAALARIAGPPRPTVRIWHRAIQRGDTLLVASLRCVTRCRVKVDVFDRLRWISHRLTLVDRHHVGVARGALRHGPLRVTIHVDDSASITGRSRFG